MSSRGHILLIDDDPDFAEFVRIVLEKAGYTLHAATNMAEGLRLVSQVKPDLVITDLMMSYELEGVELSRIWRDDPSLRKIPLVVVTAVARSLDADPFSPDEELPIAQFLTKPISPEQLLRTVEEQIAAAHQSPPPPKRG